MKVTLKKECENEINISRRKFMVLGFFLVGDGLLLFNGCASKLTSKECMNLNNVESQMECLHETLFPRVVRGIIMGAITGAVLGGVVAFYTGDAVSAGMIVGGIIGGVAGGIIAYYNFTLERANNNPKRALSDEYQDIKADNIKLQRMLTVSTTALVELKNTIEKRLNLLESSVKNIEKQQKLRETTYVNYSECNKVYTQTATKLAENTADKNVIVLLNKIVNIIEENTLTIADIYRQFKETKAMLYRLHG